MASWAEFEAAAPDLARQVRERFDAHGHKTMATLRADGSPRISGTETVWRDGDLGLGAMPGSVKVRDLRRDPRVAVHSGSDEPAVWRGDAKVAGRAVEVTGEGPGGDAPAEGHLFRLDLTEVVVVRLGEPADHLVIESWRPGEPVRRVERR